MEKKKHNRQPEQKKHPIESISTTVPNPTTSFGRPSICWWIPPSPEVRTSNAHHETQISNLAASNQTERKTSSSTGLKWIQPKKAIHSRTGDTFSWHLPATWLARDPPAVATRLSSRLEIRLDGAVAP